MMLTHEARRDDQKFTRPRTFFEESGKRSNLWSLRHRLKNKNLEPGSEPRPPDIDNRKPGNSSWQDDDRKSETGFTESLKQVPREISGKIDYKDKPPDGDV